MRHLTIAAFFACVFFLIVSPASARYHNFGSSHKGVTLHWSEVKIQNKSAVRVQLECKKNWGGKVAGLAEIAAYYISGDTLETVTTTVTCNVSGPGDGGIRKSKGSAKSLLIPVPLEQTSVEAYVDYTSASNWDVWTERLSTEINKKIEKVTGSIIRAPLDPKSAIREVVAPIEGFPLTFD